MRTSAINVKKSRCRPQCHCRPVTFVIPTIILVIYSRQPCERVWCVTTTYNAKKSNSHSFCVPLCSSADIRFCGLFVRLSIIIATIQLQLLVGDITIRFYFATPSVWYRHVYNSVYFVSGLLCDRGIFRYSYIYFVVQRSLINLPFSFSSW